MLEAGLLARSWLRQWAGREDCNPIGQNLRTHRSEGTSRIRSQLTGDIKLDSESMQKWIEPHKPTLTAVQ